ncbi:MAG: sulfatase-like hydrolase/transferase, partial [Oceanipulchritudo sp.]
ADMPLPAWAEEIKPKDGEPGPRGHTEAEWKRIVAAYYGLVTHVDEQVGRLLDYIRKAGKDEETLVAYRPQTPIFKRFYLPPISRQSPKDFG